MVSGRLRKRARALAKPPSRHLRPQEAPSSESADISIGQSSEQRTTGDSDSANPTSLPDLHAAAADAAAPSSIASNPLQNLAPGVGGGNPLQNVLQPSSAPTGATPSGPATSQAGEPSVDCQQPPQLVDGVLPERQLFPLSPTSPTPNTLSITAITAIASANITTATVIVRDVLPAVPVLPALAAADLPAIPVQTDSQLSTTLDSNVMSSNVQSVATLLPLVVLPTMLGGQTLWLATYYLIKRLGS